MGSQWIGTVFVFGTAGDEVVSLMMPVGPTRSDQFRAFKATGPHLPLKSFLNPQKVGNAATWMANLQKQGFVFTPLAI